MVFLRAAAASVGLCEVTATDPADFGPLTSLESPDSCPHQNPVDDGQPSP